MMIVALALWRIVIIAGIVLGATLRRLACSSIFEVSDENEIGVTAFFGVITES